MHQQHFLLVTFPAQGHINPARHLGRRLAGTTGARVTLSTAISAHRRMFPSATDDDNPEPKDHFDGLIYYLPYSDGFDNGYNLKTDQDDYMSRSELVGTQSLSTLASSLAAQGQPVTCVIYTMLLTWVVNIAQDMGVPSVLFWPQPATVFAVYHRYFHGYAGMISSLKTDPLATVELPGLPLLQIRDLPSFLTMPDDPGDLLSSIITCFRGMFERLDRLVAVSGGSKLIVLVTTFDALEEGMMSAVEEFEMVGIGPTIYADGEETKKMAVISGNMFEDDSKGYMEWLDSKEEGSVVYVSFGSIAKLSRGQQEEIKKGLVASGRPYLWVVRRDNRGEEEEEGEKFVGGEGDMGMVVEWCSQVKVLNHRSIGCFVTHCGWNSTLESLMCGVPIVMMPQMSDQMTNASLAEREWGIGVRVEASEGVVEGRELRRCVDLVMGVEESGEEIRKRAVMWGEKAREAIGEERSSFRNLRAFMGMI